MITEQYPALFQFFGCYFHQYWPEDYGSSDDAIDAFATSESTEAIKNAMQELKITNYARN